MNPLAPTIKRALLGVLSAAVVTSVVAAQTPETSQAPPQSTAAQDRLDVNDDAQAVVVTGCLKEEADVPGLEPNVAERAGIFEDFILTNARLGAGASSGGAQDVRSGASGSSAGASGRSAAASDETVSSSGVAGASGSGAAAEGAQPSQGARASGSSQRQQEQSSASAEAAAMYDVKGLDDDELRRHVNQQVEIRGKVDADTGEARTPSAAGADPSQRDLPEIEAESIRMIAASCSPN